MPATMSDAEVQALWDATDEDLRERDEDGVITLWTRSTDGTFRIAALVFKPIERDAA